MQQIIKELVYEIKSKSYKRIAIQSSVNKKATDLCLELQNAFENENAKDVEFYILGDVLIGHCCTDLIASKRCNADLILHLGYSCQSHLEIKIPIKYIFDKYEIDVEVVAKELNDLAAETSSTKVILAYNPGFHHAIMDIMGNLNTKIYVAQYIETETIKQEENLQYLANCPIVNSNDGDDVRLDFDKDNLLVCFLNIAGECGALLKQIALETCGSKLRVLELQGNSKSITRLNLDDYGNSLRIKRYRKIEEIERASTIGLLTIPKCLAGVNELRSKLSQLLQQSGKKCYSFSINHLTEAKLRNFPNVDIYCLLSCAETAMSLPDEIHKLIHLPFELLVACNIIDWSRQYIFSFTKLTPLIKVQESTDKEPKRAELGVIYSRQELIERGEQMLENMTINANRTFSGLDPLYGWDKNIGITKGSHGTASGYKHEHPCS